MPVIVERAASHAVAADFQPVVFGGLLYAKGDYEKEMGQGVLRKEALEGKIYD